MGIFGGGEGGLPALRGGEAHVVHHHGELRLPKVRRADEVPEAWEEGPARSGDQHQGGARQGSRVLPVPVLPLRGLGTAGGVGQGRPDRLADLP
jgi:hypothetical protein